MLDVSGGKPSFADAAVPTGFAEETAHAFAGLRAALARFVGAIPGDQRRPRDLQKALGVDYKICWQVINVVKAVESPSAVKHAPSPSALKRILAAAEGVGVSKSITGSVRSAAEQFDKVVQAHAEDRPAFDGMVAAVISNPDDAAATELQHRRAAYRSLSQIWGMQTDTYSLATFVRRSASGQGTEECMLNMKRGVRRLRPNVPAVVGGYRHHTSTTVAPAECRRPLDPEAAEKYGALVLPQFSSQPLPPLKTVPYANGWTYYEVSGDAVGRTSEVDITLGGVVAEVPFSIDTGGRHIFRASVTIKMATGLLDSTLFVHRPSFGRVSPELMMFENTQGHENPEVARQANQLPVREKVLSLGQGIEGAHSVDSPKLVDALRYACEKLNWNPLEFDAYRVRVPYPVLNSVVRVQFYFD